MGCFLQQKKKWLQNQKIRGLVGNRGIQTVVHEHFQSRIKRHKHTRREKRSRGIRCRGLRWSRAGIRNIFGNTCVYKLPVTHIYATCSWGTKWRWLVWTLQSPQTWVPMYPGKDPNTLDGCFMWFETKNSQPTRYCKLVQETKSYGSWASANKSRWKSANWKDSKPPEPSSNMAVRCPGCKEVFWKRYLYKHIFQNHANFMMTPTILSSISMYPHERDYVESLFENPGKTLTSKCPKNDKNPHDCDCAL